MNSLKSSWWACLAAVLGLFVGAVAFHTPSVKAQGGVKVTIEVVKDIRSSKYFWLPSEFNYHWSLNGFGLPDAVLQKMYCTNAEKLLMSRTTQPA